MSNHDMMQREVISRVMQRVVTWMHGVYIFKIVAISLGTSRGMIHYSLIDIQL